MSSDKTQKASKGQSFPRASARYVLVGELTSKLGDVLDISATGMRIRCKSSVSPTRGEPVKFELNGGDFAFTVDGVVRWINKTWFGARTCEIGVEFTPEDATEKTRLEKIAGWAASGASGAPPTGSKRVGEKKTEIPDLYALLGVTSDANNESIRHAFRQAIASCHPDRNPSEEAAQKFADYSKAYRVLNDPDLRDRYDAMRNAEMEGLAGAA